MPVNFYSEIKMLRNRTQRLEREGEFWRNDERELLTQLFSEGVGISEIAIRLQRSEPAIFQQIEKLDLYQRQAMPRRRKFFPEPKCLCITCHVINCERRNCPYLQIEMDG